MSRPAVLLKTEIVEMSRPAEYRKWLKYAVLLSCLKLKIVDLSRPAVLLNLKIVE